MTKRPALIISDEPERRIERLRFGFEAYAETIADLVSYSKNRTPLVVAVYGHWGSGKTTLMEAVRRALPAQQQRLKPEQRLCRTVWFDAWKSRDDDSVLTSLIEEILTALKHNGLSTLHEELSKFRSKYADVKDFGTMTRYVFGDNDFDLLADQEYQALRGRIPYLANFRPFMDDLLGLVIEGRVRKEGVDGERGVLVTFIDDLDRCAPHKVIEVLEGLKLVLDRPGLVFVLGMEQERVESAIRLAYEDRTEDEQRYEADKFLDKVVGVSFSLPALKADEVGEYLQDWCQEVPALKDYWKPVVESVNRNPRRIKRLINELNLTLALAAAADTGIAEKDAVAFTVLKYAYRETFQRLEAQPDLPARVERAVRRLEQEGGDAIDRLDLKNDSLVGIMQELSMEAPIIQDPVLRHIIRSLPTEPEAVIGYLALSRTAVRKEEPEDSGLPATRLQPGFAPVVAGPFLCGADGHEESIDYDFEIGIFPVTNREYQQFINANPEHQAPGVEADWAKDANWQGRRYPRGRENNPVVLISYHDAVAYCRWRSAQDHDGYVLRLPTEKEWEKAARGPKGNIYPWGNEMSLDRCNCRESGTGGTSAVNRYANGVSYYGCYDMAGNVWEWCDEDPPLDDPRATRVLRGGSWDDESEFVRADYRYLQYPDNLYINVGFRVVREKPGARTGTSAPPAPGS